MCCNSQIENHLDLICCVATIHQHETQAHNPWNNTNHYHGQWKGFVWNQRCWCTELTEGSAAVAKCGSSMAPFCVSANDRLLWQIAAIICVVSYWQEMHDELYGKERRITYYKKLANIRTAALSGAMTPYRSHFASQTTLVTSQGAVNTGYVEKYWHSFRELSCLQLHVSMVTVQCIIPAVGIVYLRSVLYAGKNSW